MCVCVCVCVCVAKLAVLKAKFGHRNMPMRKRKIYLLLNNRTSRARGRRQASESHASPNVATFVCVRPLRARLYWRVQDHVERGNEHEECVTRAARDQTRSRTTRRPRSGPWVSAIDGAGPRAVLRDRAAMRAGPHGACTEPVSNVVGLCPQLCNASPR